MGTLLDMLKSRDRSTRWGAAAGFGIWGALWLLQQSFQACCNYTLPIPAEVYQIVPLAVAMAVQDQVRDEYAPGEPLLTKAERAQARVEGKPAEVAAAEVKKEAGQ